MLLYRKCFCKYCRRSDSGSADCFHSGMFTTAHRSDSHSSDKALSLLLAFNMDRDIEEQAQAPFTCRIGSGSNWVGVCRTSGLPLWPATLFASSRTTPQRMPLADVTAINYLIIPFTAVLARLLLNEPYRSPRSHFIWSLPEALARYRASNFLRAAGWIW